MPPSLSALIIAKDEERDLPACLESLKGLASEIVVVIDETTKDGTETIAKAAGATVSRRRFDDYAGQRNAALALCTKDWVLWIDADERVSPDLAAEIPLALGSGAPAAAFDIPFRVRFLGRTLRWGGLGSERHLRLFSRARAKFEGGALHESLKVDGPSFSLSGPIEHEPYRDLSEYMEKLDRYTTLAAQKRFDAGRRFHAWDHLRLPVEFAWRALFRLGFLDGRAGLVWAGLAAFHSWLKYAKLKEMETRR